MKNLVENYILQHIDEENEQLSRLYRDVQVQLLHPRMVSGHLQGRVLKMLARISQSKKILEIGTYAGYATLCLAEILPDNGKIYTIEKNDEIEEFIQQQFRLSPFKSKIQLYIGNALNIIPQLHECFDMIFIDADKHLYSKYYDLVFNKVRKGGIIIADNTLWNERIWGNYTSKNKQITGISSFNEKIKYDTRIEKVILPLRDGLTIIYKK